MVNPERAKEIYVKLCEVASGEENDAVMAAAVQFIAAIIAMSATSDKAVDIVVDDLVPILKRMAHELRTQVEVKQKLM